MKHYTAILWVCQVYFHDWCVHSAHDGVKRMAQIVVATEVALPYPTLEPLERLLPASPMTEQPPLSTAEIASLVFELLRSPNTASR